MKYQENVYALEKYAVKIVVKTPIAVIAYATVVTVFLEKQFYGNLLEVYLTKHILILNG